MIEPALRIDSRVDSSSRTLRRFALISFVVFGAAATWNLFVTGARDRAAWLAALAVVIACIGLLRPAALRPIFVAAVALTRPIGALVSRLLLVLIYYAVFTPIAVLFRFIGRDELVRRRPRGAQTYWSPKRMPSNPREYLRQS